LVRIHQKQCMRTRACRLLPTVFHLGTSSVQLWLTGVDHTVGVERMVVGLDQGAAIGRHPLMVVLAAGLDDLAGGGIAELLPVKGESAVAWAEASMASWWARSAPMA